MSPFGPLLFLVLALACSSIVGQSQIDWCQVKQQYCGSSYHIACMPNNFPTQTNDCLNVQLVLMNATLKNQILNTHNAYRQEIASGSNPKFPQAKKLAVIEWDDTLQFLAEKHVSYCSFEHDECRATPQYPLSGQNLYYQTMWNMPNASSALEDGMEAWFEEWEIARAGVVDNLVWDDWEAYHFTVMVNDRNNRVGCGLIKYTTMMGTWVMDSFMLTCNYQYTNMMSTPVYTRGSPCSECTCSAQYPALCAGSGGAGTTSSTTTPATTTTTKATTTTTTKPTTTTTKATTTTKSTTTTTTGRPCFVR